MSSVLLFLGLICLSGFSSYQSLVNRRLKLKLKNTHAQLISFQPRGQCLPIAVRAETIYKHYKRLKKNWSNILIVKFEDKEDGNVQGHAITLFEHNNMIFSYDTLCAGMYLTNDLTLKDNPIKLAQIWYSQSGVQGKVLYSKSIFLTDFQAIQRELA